MAKKKKFKKKNKYSIKITRLKASLGLIFFSCLYFFTLFLAPESPLFSAYKIIFYNLFGKWGSFVFFAIMTIFGISIFLNEQILQKKIFRKILILMFLLSAILNFEIISGTKNQYQDLGGYISAPLLYITDFLFNSNITTIKLFYIILFILCIGWIIYSLEIRITPPKFQIELQTGEINKKITDKIDQPKTKAVSKSTDLTINNENKKSLEKETLKSIIKDKISKKLNEKEQEKQQQSLFKFDYPSDKPTYDINLLQEGDNSGQYKIDEDYLFDKAQSLKAKLEEFGIPVDIEGFNIGPTVIQIKIKPQAGIKVAKIENLKKDLSLSLKTKSLRILAPIPGTDSVGIEIQNPKPAIVRLREIIGSIEFSQGMTKNFTNLTLGKGIDGSTIIKNLQDMPHILVAGATGSGKSVGVNDFILSLIYQNSPSELKLIMVDPKQVELSIYEGIPYLLSPIITAPEKALKVLKRATMHMDERYTKLKDAKVRNIDEYNQKVQNPEEKMYRIVIIIDELADLMMSGNKKDTENAIARIAQKARAVGMHLIVATQRPSVNVITGLIKANIPTRMAFGVVSQIDSRTIIDTKGAEDLVGKGDLLYIDPSLKHPLRIQAPFVSTLETEKVVNEIKNKYMQGLDESQIYHPEIINILESRGETAGIGGGDMLEGDEELVSQAIEIIMETRKASATLLQRKLGIGFARAARVMDILEQRGIIGPQDGAKPREIYI